MDVTPPDISVEHAGFNVLSVGNVNVHPQHAHVSQAMWLSSCYVMFWLPQYEWVCNDFLVAQCPAVVILLHGT